MARKEEGQELPDQPHRSAWASQGPDLQRTAAAFTLRTSLALADTAGHHHRGPCHGPQWTAPQVTDTLDPRASVATAPEASLSLCGSVCSINQARPPKLTLLLCACLLLAPAGTQVYTNSLGPCSCAVTQRQTKLLSLACTALCIHSQP